MSFKILFLTKGKNLPLFLRFFPPSYLRVRKFLLFTFIVLQELFCPMPRLSAFEANKGCGFKFNSLLLNTQLGLDVN